MSERKNLWELFVPIALETLFMMLAGTVDTFMLSTVSSTAVGAVGTANTYINIFIIFLGIISSGMVAVVTQYIGAGRLRAAGQALRLGLGFNGLIGLTLSCVLFFGGRSILTFAGVVPLLLEPALIYLKIVGAGSILNAVISVFSSYLRAFGHTRQSLAATIVSNLLNLALNAVFLFVYGWGVAGVALATLISRIFNLLVDAVLVRLKISTDDGTAAVPNREILWQMIRIGMPAAMETALYNFASALVVRFLNQMDTQGLNTTARVYTQQLSGFSFCCAAAMAQANGLMVGWEIGAGELERCDRQTRRAALIAIGSAAVTASLFALSSRTILGLLTQDPELIRLTAMLLTMDVLLEVGRSANLVYGQALKVSGDALYTSIVGAVFMYLIMVGGSWLFGLHLRLLAVGATIALTLDECIRAVFLYARWRSGKWRSKGIFCESKGKELSA